MNIFSNVFSNTFYQMVSRIVSSGSILLVTLVITRNLSRDVWGDFVTVISFVGLFSVISDFGINAIFVKEITKNQKSLPELFGNLLSLRLVISVFVSATAITALFILPYSYSVKVGVLVGLLIIFLQSIFISCSAIFQQKLRYDFYAASDILGSLSIIFLVFVSTLIGSSLFIIVAIFVVGNLIKSFFALIFSRKLVGKINLRFETSTWKYLLKASLPIGVMLILSQFNANIDKQIISLTNPEKLGVPAVIAVGIYGLSYRIFDFVIAFSAFSVNSLYPILNKKIVENKSEFIELSKKAMVILFFSGLLVGIVGWIFSPLLLRIFGDYQESLTSLRILFLGSPLFFVSSLILWLNITLGKEKFLPLIYSAALICNLLLNLVFIPKYGYNVAAWSTNVTELVILILLGLLLNYRPGKINENIGR